MSELETPSKNNAFHSIRLAIVAVVGIICGIFAGSFIGNAPAPGPKGSVTNAPALYTYFVGAYADGAFVQYVPVGPPFTMVCPSNSFSIVYDGKRLNGLRSIQVVVTTNVIPIQTNAPTTSR